MWYSSQILAPFIRRGNCISRRIRKPHDSRESRC
jgi:hypothetical protein